MLISLNKSLKYNHLKILIKIKKLIFENSKKVSIIL